MTVTNLYLGARSQSISHAEPSVFTPAQAQELLRTKCAPWVQDLNLIVEECSVTGARLRLPYSPRVTRVGGTICGQALMACADSAMAIAITALFGEFRNIATVGQTISFMRAIAIEDVIIVASVPKLGTNLIFGEVTFSASGAHAIAAYATATWAIIPARANARPID